MKSNKDARKEKPGDTRETSKRIFEIDLTERFRDRIRALPKETRREIARTIEAIQEVLGRPHQHTGVEVRKLRRNYFECRVGLDLRLIFRVEPGLATFTFAGNHDEVRRYMLSAA